MRSRSCYWSQIWSQLEPCVLSGFIATPWEQKEHTSGTVTTGTHSNWLSKHYTCICLLRDNYLEFDDLRTRTYTWLGCINITSVIWSGRHMLRIVGKDRIVWGAPKVQAMIIEKLLIIQRLWDPHWSQWPSCAHYRNATLWTRWHWV